MHLKRPIAPLSAATAPPDLPVGETERLDTDVHCGQELCVLSLWRRSSRSEQMQQLLLLSQDSPLKTRAAMEAQLHKLYGNPVVR